MQKHYCVLKYLKTIFFLENYLLVIWLHWIAMYHAKCLITLFNEAKQQCYGRDYDDNKKHLHGIAVAKLDLYVKQTVTIVDGVLKLAELVKVHGNIKLGGKAAGRIYKTRLISLLLPTLKP